MTSVFVAERLAAKDAAYSSTAGRVRGAARHLRRLARGREVKERHPDGCERLYTDGVFHTAFEEWCFVSNRRAAGSGAV